MTSYGEAICEAYEYLLERHSEFFVLGQGLWSPWYVGNTMTGLEKRFGRDRVIDTPVSELASTGVAVGAGLCGYRVMVVHPRMDFMLYCMDAIVNEAAKWSHMLGGQASPAVVIRGIINRGGEQGAQHSQALHAWFAHVPGLRVVMPATPVDARDLMIAAVLCGEPVVYVDDRWLYDLKDDIPPVAADKLDLRCEGPRVIRQGRDITLVGAGYATYQCMQAAESLAKEGIEAEVVDLRVLNPLDPSTIVSSVQKTGSLLAVDVGWRTCGLAGEVLAMVAERIPLSTLRGSLGRITLPDAPAPVSKPLEAAYYFTVGEIINKAREMVA